MARKWSGFVPQNLATKEEWELMLEAYETQVRRNEVGVTTQAKTLEPGNSSKRRVSQPMAKDK